MDDTQPDDLSGGGQHAAGSGRPEDEPHGAVAPVDPSPALPPYACRAARIAGHVAAVLRMPAALVDFGGADGAFGVGHPPFDLDAVVAGWAPPAERSGPASVQVAGATCIAFPVSVGSRKAWIAAVDAVPRALPPEAAGVQALIAELEEEARISRAALSAWVRRLEDEHRRIERAHRLVGIGTLVHDAEAGILETSPSAADVLGVGDQPRPRGVVEAIEPERAGRLELVTTGEREGDEEQREDVRGDSHDGAGGTRRRRCVSRFRAFSVFVLSARHVRLAPRPRC